MFSISKMLPVSNTDKGSPEKEDFLRNIAKDPVEMNGRVAVQNDKNSEKQIEEINERVATILPQKWKGKYTLSVFDNLISLAVVGPLVVGHWCGMWGLMDFYKLPLSDWLSFVLGMGLHCTFACFRRILHRTFAEHWRLANPIGRGGYRVARLVYTYLFSMSCVLHWRGGWAFFDYVVNNNLWVDAALTLVLLAILIILKSSRNLLAPPFIIAVDIPPLVFNFPTRYRAVIGYIIVAITFCFQPVMRYVCSRLQGLSRLLAADAFLVLSFLGTVNVWRGIWGLLEVWLFPENMELSCWITHAGCFLFLGLLNCSNSILVRGVYIDAEEEEGKCVVFPCHYLRLFFKIEREKKEARRRTHLVPSRDYPPSESGGKDAENGALLNCSPLPTIIPANPECLVLK
ncbi:uncharacterized protein LOC135165439 isoform X3 [Diachasmimorpha longicaudata]|uniref:uncharacterized protein LOC135165439 isoform X3 n=1 Tax=Diachasmimorpha longicaudata TaxID=58733 RepID=UPI0030B8D824